MIDPAKVRSLLFCSGWEDLRPGTFEIEEHGFERGDAPHAPGYKCRDASGHVILGPLAAVLAFRCLGPTTQEQAHPTIRSG